MLIYTILFLGLSLPKLQRRRAASTNDVLIYRRAMYGACQCMKAFLPEKLGMRMEKSFAYLGGSPNSSLSTLAPQQWSFMQPRTISLTAATFAGTLWIQKGHIQQVIHSFPSFQAAQLSHQFSYTKASFAIALLTASPNWSCATWFQTPHHVQMTLLIIIGVKLEYLVLLFSIEEKYALSVSYWIMQAIQVVCAPYRKCHVMK